MDTNFRKFNTEKCPCAILKLTNSFDSINKTHMKIKEQLTSNTNCWPNELSHF